MAARSSLPTLLASLLLGAGCEAGPPPGLCWQPPASAATCETHGGTGRLVSAIIDVETGEVHERTERQWEAAPHGYSFVRSAGEEVYLFGAHDGRLLRGTWQAGQLSWEAEPQMLGRGFTSFEVHTDEATREAVAVFTDAHRGRHESWRVSGELARLHEQDDADLLAKRKLSWVPGDDGRGPRALAYEPGASRHAWFVEPGRVEMATLPPAETYRFARAGRSNFALSYGPDTSGRSLSRVLELAPVDRHGQLARPILHVEDLESWDEVELLSDPEGTELWIARYRQLDGRVHLSRVNPHDGAITAERESVLPPNLADLEWDFVPEGLRVLGLNEEGRSAVRTDRLDAIVAHLREGLENRPGYQFVVMQSGHVLHEEAGGWAETPSPARPTGRPMSTRDRLNIASVSKMITAITVLRMHDAGILDLDGEFIDYLDPIRHPDIDPSWQGLTVRELLTHRGGMPQEYCRVDSQGQPDCGRMLAEPRELWRCETDDDGHPCCPRWYANGHYHLLRVMIGDLIGDSSNDAIAEYARLDWMEDIGVEGASCSPAENDAYYRFVGPTYDDYLERRPVNQAGCGQSGWHLSARDLARIARAIRYNWLFTPETHAELLSCGSHGWLGWDDGWSVSQARGKSGWLSNDEYASQAVLARLPTDLDIIVLTNSVDEFSLKPLVQAAYWAH